MNGSKKIAFPEETDDTLILLEDRVLVHKHQIAAIIKLNGILKIIFRDGTAREFKLDLLEQVELKYVAIR